MQRVFRKDAFYGDEQWNDIREHDGDLRDPASKTPWELACHQAMANIPNCDDIVRPREGRRRELIDHEGMSFRLYTEWCQYGDLSHLIHQCEDAGSHVPEEMIWNVAESLANCAVAMAEGGGQPGWREIVHR